MAITPSALYRVANCLGSEALPQYPSHSHLATQGVTLHNFLSAPSLEEGLARCAPEDRSILEQVPVELLPAFRPEAYAAEVAFAMDWATGRARELGRVISREMAASLCRPGEMPGIADVVGLSDDAVEIHDYKRGRSDHIERAEVNWQIRTYAVMAARTYGRTAARGSIIRGVGTGAPWADRFEMDSLDLDAHEADVRELLARAAAVREAGKGPIAEGPWCKYCPAFASCPAKQGLLRSFVPEAPDAPTPLEMDTVALEWTPERAARAWDRLKAAKVVIARMEAMVEDYATNHPFPLPNGRLVGLREKSREALVPVKTKASLEKLFGQVGSAVYTAAEEREVSVTKAALKRELKKLVVPTTQKKQLAPVERQVLEAIRTAGGVSVATWTAVEEFEPPEPEKLEPGAQLPPTEGEVAFG